MIAAIDWHMGPEKSSCEHQLDAPGIAGERTKQKGDKVVGIPQLGPGVPCISERECGPTSSNIAH